MLLKKPISKNKEHSQKNTHAATSKFKKLTLKEYADKGLLKELFNSFCLPPRKQLGIETKQEWKLLARLHSKYLKQKEEEEQQLYQNLLSLDREEQDDVVQDNEFDIPALRMSSIRLIPAD